MEERWKLESSDNELKFFFDETLVIHLYKTNRLWYTNVLGRDKIYCYRNLSEAIKNAELGAKECGWI
jgi:hypothetical protein